MYKVLQDVIMKFPARRRTTPNGWEQFYGSVCCVYNNESRDKRGRAGIRINEDSMAYHCFNCGFTTHFMPGRNMVRSMRELLEWMGIDRNEIKRLSFESWRLKKEVGEFQPKVEIIKVDYKEIEIPGNVNPLNSLINQEATEYILDRGFNCQDFDFFLTDSTYRRLHKRIIIPFFWEDTIVGFTARLPHDSKDKYYMEKPANYVYNVNNQKKEREYVLVHEGPLDALATGGVALCGNHCNSVQVDVIESLNKQVVVVPDKNKAGQKLIDAALENYWAVAFPEWENDIDDAAKAMERYGRIYTLQSILSSVVTNQLKIKLLRKKIG